MTIASPPQTTPSKGITLPIWTRILSPTFTSAMLIFTSSPPSVTSHTFVVCKDMLRARSSTDFLWVHSSNSSPISSKNIMEPAVVKSLRSTDTPIAVASSTGTSILRCHRVFTPLAIYLTDLTVVITLRMGMGNSHRFP